MRVLTGWQRTTVSFHPPGAHPAPPVSDLCLYFWKRATGRWGTGLGKGFLQQVSWSPKQPHFAAELPECTLLWEKTLGTTPGVHRGPSVKSSCSGPGEGSSFRAGRNAAVAATRSLRTQHGPGRAHGNLPLPGWAQGVRLDWGRGAEQCSCLLLNLMGVPWGPLFLGDLNKLAERRARERVSISSATWASKGRVSTDHRLNENHSLL